MGGMPWILPTVEDFPVRKVAADLTGMMSSESAIVQSWIKQIKYVKEVI